LTCHARLQSSHGQLPPPTPTVGAPEALRAPLHVVLPIGVSAGLIGSLTGIGGGLVIIPSLHQLTNMTMHQISATSLLTITLSSSVGALTYMAQGAADLPVAAILASAAMLTTGLGARFNSRLPAQTLSRLIGGIMLVSVPLVLMRKPQPHAATAATATATTTATTASSTQVATTVSVAPLDDMRERLARYYTEHLEGDKLPGWAAKHAPFVAVGAVVGFASGLLGIGGGLLMTTYISANTDMTQHSVVATSLAAMLPIGLASSFRHYKAGNIKLKVAGALAVSSAVSMFVGAKFIAPHCSEETLRQFFAGLLLVSSVRMLFG
jgi:uncharacterized membrane protein YfcA